MAGQLKIQQRAAELQSTVSIFCAMWKYQARKFYVILAENTIIIYDRVAI